VKLKRGVRPPLAACGPGLLSLVLMVALFLVAPVGVSGGLDPHRGEALHPVFVHAHPDAPARTTALAMPSLQPQLHAAQTLDETSPASAIGQLLPRAGALPGVAQRLYPLWLQSLPLPVGASSAPPDPPPNLA
jgi:hypothetical protein